LENEARVIQSETVAPYLASRDQVAQLIHL
jgi:hypothetical protein